MLALVCRDIRDIAGASDAIDPLKSLPRSPIQHLAGLIANDQGDQVEAARLYRRALVCDPGYGGAWLGLIRLPALSHGELKWWVASTIVNGGDLESARGLACAALSYAKTEEVLPVRRLVTEAISQVVRSQEARTAVVSLLMPDGGFSEAAGDAIDDHEHVLERLVEAIATWSDDAGAVRAGLKRRLQRLAMWCPHQRPVWRNLLSLDAREASPGDTSVLRSVWRVVAFGGLHARTGGIDGLFEACVEAKRQAIVNRDETSQLVGHALGLQVLSETAGLDIELRWRSGSRSVRIGDRQVGYALASPGVTSFLAHMFIFEPGLWRWMAGFGPDDVLLDIGANVGIYTIAAAGLFGVPVVAVEPYAPNLKTLRGNIAANGLGDRIQVLPIAATDVERRGRLFHEGGRAGAASQHFEDDTAASGPDVEFEEVEGIPIDVLVDRGTIPFPTRVKIDVDGNERAVIEGMTRALADPRLHSVRMEVRWREPEGRAAVERVKSFGFDATIDDDPKNLLFTRVKLPSETG